MKLSNVWAHYWGTTLHKFWVFWYVFWFCVRMLWRAVIHDYTKYGWTESKGFFETIHLLRTTTYGTSEYQELLDRIKPSLDHHYKAWSHHPEHYNGGVNNMSLEDLVEMFCDWKAAVRRHVDGDIHRSIRLNEERFGMAEQLRKIMENSV